MDLHGRLLVQQQSIDLNTEGVNHLQAGDTFAACNSFGKASSLLSTYIDNNIQPLQPGCKRPINWVQLPSSSFVSLSDHRKQIWDDGSFPILFLRALKIESTPTESPFTWAILYNLALSCHIHACKLGANGRQHLQKAHEMYDVVRTQFLPQVSSEDTPMLSLALYNNMGCIYREFSMFKESQQCLKRAKEILIDIHRKQGGLGDLKGVSLNLMALKKPSRAPAA